MSRSYSTFQKRQPFTDGWKQTTHSAMVPSDHVHRPVIIDAEGRQIPIIRSNGESYVIKAEEIVERIVPAPVSGFLVAEYRYGSEQPGNVELFRDRGNEKGCTDLGSTYRRPEKVEYRHPDSAFDHYPERVKEFITMVVTEADRGPTRTAAVPLASAWHSDPNRNVQENTRKYADEGDFWGDDRKKPTGNQKWNGHNEPCVINKRANTHPIIVNNRDVYDFYERPQVNQGPNVRNRPLSKPTNDIGTATEYLKGDAIKPCYGNRKKEEEFNGGAYTEAGRPTKAVPLATTPWRTSPNMSGTETIKPKEYDSGEEEEESQHLRLCSEQQLDEQHSMNSRGGAKPIKNKDGHENPKGNAAAVRLGRMHYPGSTIQNKAQNSYPETINSKEASRRYGKLSSRAKEEEECKGTISSRDAVRKYNGALVP